MKKLSTDELCVLHVGPQESLLRIADAIAHAGKNDPEVLRAMIQGKKGDAAYCLWIDQWELFPKGAERITTEDCESLVFYPQDDFHMNKYAFSPLGTTVFTPGSLFELDGVLSMNASLPAWLRVLIRGHYEEKRVTITLKDGKKLSYMDMRGDPEAAVLGTGSGLTLGKLGASLCDFVATNKVQSFLQAFRRDVESLENVAAIAITKQDLFRDDPNIQLNFPYRNSLPYLSAYFERHTEIEVDMSALSVKRGENISFVAPEAPGAGAYHEVERVLVENNNMLNIRMGDANDPSNFVFTNTVADGIALIACLSTASTVIVPETHNNGPVSAIRENAFAGLTTMEALILPSTIHSIGKNAFSGCANLQSVSYCGEETASTNFMIREKSKLISVVTMDKEYTVPADINSVGNYAFTGCLKLKKIILHKGIGRISADAFSACKGLKTIMLPADWTKLNATALERAKIKEVVLPSGMTVKITDPYLYECFEVSEGSYIFDYKKAAENISAASGAGAYKTAAELLKNHLSEIGDNASPLVDIAVRECIAKKDARSLDEFLSVPASYQIDFEKMLMLANKTEAAEITAVLLRHSQVDTAVYTECATPAEPGPQLYVKVRFDDNKVFSYFCRFVVEIGDKVYVEGKRTGAEGTITEIMDEYPTGRAAMYTLQVTSASHVIRERLDLEEGL